MKNLLWSKANARSTINEAIFQPIRGAGYFGPDGHLVQTMKPLRSRRMDEVNKRMRRFLHKPTPLVDLKGKPLDGYMQLEQIPRPQGVITRTDGSTVEYEGP